MRAHGRSLKWAIVSERATSEEWMSERANSQPCIKCIPEAWTFVKAPGTENLGSGQGKHKSSLEHLNQYNLKESKLMHYSIFMWSYSYTVPLQLENGVMNFFLYYRSKQNWEKIKKSRKIIDNRFLRKKSFIIIMFFIMSVYFKPLRPGV